MRTLCDVYKSARHDLMYLYVNQADGLNRVPAALLERFGPARKTMTLLLTPERRLARENPELVLGNLRDFGYHLQLPPLHKGLSGAPPPDRADV
jgi:uncharacterized protein